jgi:hypothetical protein
MHRAVNLAFLLVTWLGFFSGMHLDASSPWVSQERRRLVHEIQQALNHSFGCDYAVVVGSTSRYASSNSAGIILVDRDFLQSADRGSLFFAMAHEYAHAFLGHDLQLHEASAEIDTNGSSPSRLSELRRRFEREADGIAARKAKECGIVLDDFVHFLVTQSDPEKGSSPEDRVYSKPKERAEYIVAVYRSATIPAMIQPLLTPPQFQP